MWGDAALWVVPAVEGREHRDEQVCCNRWVEGKAEFRDAFVQKPSYRLGEFAGPLSIVLSRLLRKFSLFEPNNRIELPMGNRCVDVSGYEQTQSRCSGRVRLQDDVKLGAHVGGNAVYHRVEQVLLALCVLIDSRT